MLSNTRNFVGALIVASVLGAFILLAALTPERVAVPFPHTINNGQETEMQSVTTTWVSDGATQSVTTPRRENEDATAWAARHKEAVDALQALFPVDQED